MRKIFLAEDCFDLNECYEGILSSYFEHHEVHTFISGRELIEKLEDSASQVDLIITDYLMLGGTGADVLHYLIENEFNIPLFLLSGVVTNNSPETRLLSEYKARTEFATKPVFTERFLEIVKRFNIKQKTSEHEYVSISDHIIALTSIVPTNIYILIGENKFVKLFNALSQYDAATFEKYKDRASDGFFIMEKDLDHFFDYYMDKLLEEDFSNSIPVDDENARIQAYTLSVVSQRLRKIGMTSKVVGVMKSLIDKNLELVSEQKDLAKLLGDLMKSGEVHYEHSICTAFVANMMLKEFKWNERNVAYKVTIASLFHDLTLENFNLDVSATLQSMLDGKAYDMQRMQKVSPRFFTHPMDAADLMMSINDIPMGVEEIISNHHELPGGKGFPLQKTGANLSKLSLIFNTAHFFTHLMYVNGWNRSGLEETIRIMESRFSDDIEFNKIFQAITPMFSKLLSDISA